MKQWFVVYTQPQKEFVAVQHLHEQGFKAYLPQFKKTRRHARKVEEVLSPLFPRYVFVQVDLSKDQWRSINGTRGVAYIIAQDNKPISLDEAIIHNLKQQETTEGLVPMKSLSLFQPGEHLTITDGPFSGQSAVFEKMTDRDRIQVLLNFLGRSTSIVLPRHSVDEL